MTVATTLWWIVPFLAVLAVTAGLLLRGRRRKTQSPAVEPVAGGRAEEPHGRPTGTSAGRTASFDLHPLFAEGKGTHLVVDGLADVADSRGAVLGVPVTLVVGRPPSPLGEDLLLAFMTDTSRGERCVVELHFVEDGVEMTLVPPGREVMIPVEAASGLPVGF